MKSYLFLLAACFCCCANAQTIPFVPGTEGGYCYWMTGLGNKLAYTSDHGGVYFELWSYEQGSAPVKLTNFQGIGGTTPFGESRTLEAVAGAVYFAANTTAAGTELHKWDGTNPPFIVKDLEPGTPGSNPSYLHALGNKLYFSGAAGGTVELWGYDPATDNFTKLSNISSGPGTSITNITSCNGKIYFTSTFTPAQDLLHEYDPATGNVITIPATVTMRKHIQFMAVGPKLYFMAMCNDTYQLCVYDGSNAATPLTAFTDGDNNAYRKGSLTFLKDKVYFLKSMGSSNACRIWVYDLASNTPAEVTDIPAAFPPSADNVYMYTAHNNKIYLVNGKTNGKYLLLTYDGTKPPVTVSDSLEMYPSEPHRQFSVHNGIVYLCGRSPATSYYPALFYFADSASGVKNIVASIKAQFYPNPAKNTTTLQFTLQSKNNLSLTVADITGKTTWQKPSENYQAGENSIQIDTRNFPAGIYHCRLAGSGNELLWSGKLVKE